MGSGPEEALIQQLDGHVATAETAATAAVQNPLTPKSPKETFYLRSPNPTTWGSVVEEHLDPLALGAGWSTQKRLSKARPDYYRNSNAIEMYVDLTSVAQAGVGGNHITGKLQNAGFLSPNLAVNAADVTHLSANPLGNAAPALMPGNATTKQMAAYQEYHRLTKSKYDEVEFADGLEDLEDKYGKVTHYTFTTKWDDKKRKRFEKDINAMKKRK